MPPKNTLQHTWILAWARHTRLGEMACRLEPDSLTWARCSCNNMICVFVTSPEREIQTPNLFTHAHQKPWPIQHLNSYQSSSHQFHQPYEHNLDTFQTPNTHMCTKVTYSVHNSIIITHLGKNANRTVLKYPNPKFPSCGTWNSWQNSITMMQYDKSIQLRVQLP